MRYNPLLIIRITKLRRLHDDPYFTMYIIDPMILSFAIFSIYKLATACIVAIFALAKLVTFSQVLILDPEYY